MNKKKSETKSTFQLFSRPDTQAETNFSNAVNSADFIDPALQFGASRAKKNVDERIDNPFGTEYSPEVGDAKRYADKQDIDQQYQNILASAGQQGQVQKLGFLGSVAGQNKPYYQQTGGTTTQSGGLIGQLLGAGLGAAGSAIGGSGK